MTRKDLVDKLAGSVGTEKATAAVDGAARALGLGAGALSYAEMLRVLEHLAVDPGIVGTVARFAKVRVILAGPPPVGLGLPYPKRRGS